VNVLIVFYSSGGRTEQLALAAGVGAIQGRASIRLRRLPPGQEIKPDGMTASERVNFERMSRDYTAPRPVDAEWADALILATSPEGALHVGAYLERLPRNAPNSARIAAPLIADAAPRVLLPLYAAAAEAGLIVVPMPAGPLASADEGQAFGRRIVALAKAIKTAA